MKNEAEKETKQNMPETESEAGKGTKTNKTGVILCVIGVLLCLAGAIMLIISLNRKPDTEPKAEDNSFLGVVSDKTEKDSTKTEQTQQKESVESSEAVVKEETEVSAESSEQESTELPERQEGELATPATCGALSVDGAQLVDQNGNPVQLRGISSHGLSWFPSFIDQNAFREFRQNWNVNVMRLAMYTHENGGYCTDGNKEDLKNIIYRGVQYATDNDMYVIIDWHVLQDQNPNKYKEEAKDFFAGMSKKYKDNNNVIYEICNEPNGNTSWKDIKSYAEEIIPVIRENDKDAVILVGTPNWSQRVDEAAADPITGYDNIMYTLHFYAATHKDDLRKTMEEAIKKNLPVFVSEYGICDASGNGGLDKTSAQKWIDLMDQYQVSYVCWALANKNESAALIKSSCSKTSQFTDSDLSESGKWLYQMLTGNKTAPSDGKNSTGTDTSSQPQQQPSADDFQSGGFDISISLNNNWGADGKVNYQYNFTITNTGDSKVNGWAIDIHFSSDISFESGWGGVYTVNGNTLHVTNVDYNGTINGGQALSDLGFIISGPDGLKVTK